MIASEEGDVVRAAKDNVTLGTVDVNYIDYHLRKKSGTGGFTGKSKSSKNNPQKKSVHKFNQAMMQWYWPAIMPR